MREVINLATDESVSYIASLSPREAVISAYATQTKKDFNTWTWKERYDHLVVEGKCSVACGDWCTKL